MRDPLLQLPVPILLVIIKAMPDFPSLDHCIQASPAANGIFEELSLEITIGSIDGLPNDVVEAIQALSALPRKLCTSERVPKSGRTQMLQEVYELSLTKPTQYRLVCDPMLSSIRDLLQVACRIHDITTLFFEIHINRINAMRPMHLLNLNHNSGYDAFVGYPEGHTYTPLQTGPASVVEALRVARGLWRLQYFVTLWSLPSDHNIWTGMLCLEAFWDDDEIACLEEFLVDNHITLYPPDPDQPSQKASSLPASLTLAYPPLNSSTLADPPTDPSSKAWRQDIEAAEYKSPAYDFFHGYANVVSMSPLKDWTWRPLRRLGFTI